MSGTLYVIATPIGNKDDITVRAKQILSEVDIIAAEDTRTTQNLLNLYGISTRTISNHKFNELRQKDLLIDLLLEGNNVAIVSDAGTPCISDPGFVIIKAAIEKDIRVIGICGANAAITALSISGFYCSSFSFFGFLPRKNGEISGVLEKAKNDGTRVGVFYESPKRIKNTISIISQILPDANICLCNDLTKYYERIYRGSPEKVLNDLKNNPSAEKGEYTLVLEFPRWIPKEVTSEGKISSEALIVDYMIKHNVSAKEAISLLAGKDISKKELYAASLNVKNLFLEH